MYPSATIQFCVFLTCLVFGTAGCGGIMLLFSAMDRSEYTGFTAFAFHAMVVLNMIVLACSVTASFWIGVAMTWEWIWARETAAEKREP